MRTKSGQAMMELAVGMLALAMVVSALAGFATYIARSLKAQNALRVKSPHQTDTVPLSDFDAKYVFGEKELKIEEAVTLPPTTILR